MKSKITLLCLFVLILALLVGCNTVPAGNDIGNNNRGQSTEGGTDGSTENNDNSNNNDYNDDGNGGDNSGENIPSEPEQGGSDIPITEDDRYKIDTHGYAFSGGVAFVTYTVSEKENWWKTSSQTVAIDAEGNVLYECPDFIQPGYHQYKNGVLVVENVIYDKKLNVIASPEKDGYQKLYATNACEYFLAYKKVESFAGDTEYLGVLNARGEWVEPLSSEHPILLAFRNKTSYGNPVLIEDMDEHHLYTHDADSLALGAYVDIEDNIRDEFFYSYDLRNGRETYDMSNRKLYAYCYCYHSEEKTCGIYQEEPDGTRALVVEGHFEEHYDIRLPGNQNDYFVFQNEGGEGCLVYDYDGKLLLDASAYDITTIFYTARNGYFLCEIKNSTQDKYLCLFTPSSAFAFDPLRIDNITDGGSVDLYFLTSNENGFLFDYGYNSAMFLDYNGNYIIKNFSIENYNCDEESGLIAVACYTDNNAYDIYINFKGETVIDTAKINFVPRAPQ